MAGRLQSRLKSAVFRALGKDPEAVVVSFLSGEAALGRRMLEEIRGLEPERRHFAVSVDGTQTGGAEVRDAESVALEPGSAWGLYRQLRRRFRKLRIGLAPVLMTRDPAHRSLRIAAFLLAPTKMLAYNARLERHHLRLRSAVSSLLFLRGVPVDRISLRPRLEQRGIEPESSYRVIDGRPFLPGRSRVAILSPYFPYPLAHGGAVRMFHLLREASREFDIVLFSFSDGDAELVEPVLEFCSRVILVRRPRSSEPHWSTLRPAEVVESRSATMQALWDGLTQELGVAVRQVEYTQMASYGGDILVAHDLNADLFRQVAARERTLGARWNAWRWRRYEKHMLKQYRRVVVMSERDARLAPCAAARVIPNGVDLEHFRPEPEQPGQRLLFIGAFRHFPNAAAWRFFAEEVWPRLAPRVPEMTVTAVSGADPELYWRMATGTLEPPSHERFRMQGFVTDVRPLYVEANIAIVPTLASAGTNLKTLEAMAMERAIVATSSGCKGLGLEHGVSAWIADGAEAFAEGVAKLGQDPELRRRLAGAARRLAEERFGWADIGLRERDLLREVIHPPLVVRKARESDVPELDRIQHSSPEAVLWEPSGYLAYDCRVAESRGAVAGFLVCRTLAADEAEVLSLVVDPKLRRRGVAQTLMRKVLDDRRGTWYLEVRESNWPARNLYKKLGFEDISLRPDYYQDTGETAVVMRLKPC